MPTPPRKPPETPPARDAKGRRAKPEPTASPLVRAFDAAFRALASLQLAVISLSTLVIYLTAGMIFERNYGNQALQDYFYRTWYFALLLGILGMNILCAALIRFPWKKRQTGFVVTHAGLLVLIAGSWVGFQMGDEGQVGMVEGSSASTLVRTTHHRIRVQPIDPETRQPTGDGMAFPFYPGAFDWPADRAETLSRDGDPYDLKATAFFPASAGKLQHTKVPSGGLPMVRLGANMKPPGSAQAMDLFATDTADQQKWLIADPVFMRKVKSIGPATFRLTYADSSQDAAWIADFPNLPEKGLAEFARLRYTDKNGKQRAVDYFPAKDTWNLGEGQTAQGREATLPDSDIKATYKLSGMPMKPEVFERLKTQFHVGAEDSHTHLRLVDFLSMVAEQTGERLVPLAEFEITKGQEAPVVVLAVPIARTATLGFRPSAEDPAVLDRADPPATVTYYHPPEFSEGMSGTKGVIDILATSDGKLSYRSINREGIQGEGRLEQGEEATAFGGGPNQPMKMDFRIDDFLKSGKQEFVYVPIEMPVGQAGNGIPAVRVELGKGSEKKEAWLRLGITPDLQPDPREAKTLVLGDRAYQVWFDVDRQPLPFELKLVDFKRRFDPGTQQAKSFESDVLLTDEEEGIRNAKHNISMNEPLTHRNYTFYQSSFDPPSDASGQFISVFQVRYDPTWAIVYIGCLLVVVGTFLQFYMRAGVFTDGGKKERERDQARDPKATKAPAKAPEPAIADF